MRNVRSRVIRGASCACRLSARQYTLRRVRRTHLWAVVALLAFAWRLPLFAHDIPRDVVVHVFMKPDPDRLRMVVRVPLAAMRDMQFPQHTNGTLDVASAEPALREAVALWLLPGLDVREADEPLPAPAVSAVRVSL